MRTTRRQFMSLAASGLALTGGLDALAADARLEELLEPLREKFDLPAVYGAIATSDGILAAAAGVRRRGDTTRASRVDRVRIGSVSKPFTSTATMKAIELRRFASTTRIGELFPEMDGFIRPEYLKVTIEDLLLHTAGLTNTEPPEMNQKRVPAEAVQFAIPGVPYTRYAYTLRLLQCVPTTAFGKYNYSNPGYIALATALERATRVPFEEFVRANVFAPLGLSTAMYGMPGSEGGLEQPWYHPVKNGTSLPPFSGSPRNDQAAIAASQGGVCLSIRDLARFGQVFLGAGADRPAGLSPGSYRQLIMASPRVASRTLAWEIAQHDKLGKTLQHTGTNGDPRGAWSNAVLTIAPDKHLCVAIATNRGEAWDAIFAARDALAAWALQSANKFQ